MTAAYNVVRNSMLSTTSQRVIKTKSYFSQSEATLKPIVASVSRAACNLFSRVVIGSYDFSMSLMIALVLVFTVAHKGHATN